MGLVGNKDRNNGGTTWQAPFLLFLDGRREMKRVMPNNAKATMHAFEKALRKCFPKDGFPLEVVGDLDDLRFTLERLAGALARVTAGEDCPEIRQALYEVEFILGEELSLIAADLLPLLKDLRLGSLKR